MMLTKTCLSLASSPMRLRGSKCYSGLLFLLWLASFSEREFATLLPVGMKNSSVSYSCACLRNMSSIHSKVSTGLNTCKSGTKEPSTIPAMSRMSATRHKSKLVSVLNMLSVLINYRSVVDWSSVSQRSSMLKSGCLRRLTIVAWFIMSDLFCFSLSRRSKLSFSMLICFEMSWK